MCLCRWGPPSSSSLSLPRLVDSEIIREDGWIARENNSESLFEDIVNMGFLPGSYVGFKDRICADSGDLEFDGLVLYFVFSVR